MAAQCSERSRFGIDLEWNVVCIEPAGREHDQRAERVGPDQIVQDIDAGFCEMAGDVHALSLAR